MSAPVIRSPPSPYEQQSKPATSFAAARSCYASSPLTMSPELSSGHQGLGLYGCSLPSSSASDLSPVTHTSDHWSDASMDYPSHSQPPDIFSAAFNPFSDFSTASTTGMVGVHSPEAPELEFCQTPPSSNMPSHRSSVSSYAGSVYSPPGSDGAYTPRVKVEEPGEWYRGHEHVLQRALSAHGPLSYAAPSPNPLASQTDDLYRPAPGADWSKADTAGFISELHTSPDGRLPRFDVPPMLSNGSRIKKKRQRTTPEEATHECDVCGKLFKRSYNWKSHLETHNPERKYPHPCTALHGGNPCTKKFQRKTDLDRHYDSVHLKTKNHQCDLCGNRFARRDTLRRHTEDGCPKRFELGVRETSVVAPAGRWPFPTPSTPFPPRSRSYSVGLPHQSPMAPPSAASTGTFPVFPRSEYPGAHLHHRPMNSHHVPSPYPS